jgi:hypothetical protein
MMNRLATMLKSLSFAAPLIVLLTACSTPKPKSETAQQPIIEPAVGTIMRRFAIERSLQECKTKNLIDVECKKWIDDAERHLESVNARIDALLPRSTWLLASPCRLRCGDSEACSTPAIVYLVQHIGLIGVLPVSPVRERWWRRQSD